MPGAPDAEERRWREELLASTRAMPNNVFETAKNSGYRAKNNPTKTALLKYVEEQGWGNSVSDEGALTDGVDSESAPLFH